jgi:heme exporter protein D
MSLQEFLHMDGYAFYVWSAYAVVGVVLAANLIYPLRRRRQLLREISKLSIIDVTDDSKT